MKKADKSHPAPTAAPSPEAAATAASPGPGPGSAGSQAQAPEAAPGPAPAASAPPDVAALQAEAAKAREYYEKWLRAAAEFDNYKKRMARERAEATKYATESLIQSLIPVLDNFDMALAAVNHGHGGTQGTAALREGVSMVHQQFKNVLLAAGLEEIQALHQPFDPRLHEAVSEQVSAEVPEGHVLQQVRKGYKLRDRLLRPASVIVAKAPAPAAGKEERCESPSA